MTEQKANTAPSIYLALAAIMRDSGAIAKDNENKAQGFKFRSVYDVYNSLHPILSAHGVVCIPSVVSVKTEMVGLNAKGNHTYQTTLIMGYKLVSGHDGSSVEGTIAGEGMDFGDKSTAKAMSVAHKYFLLQMFLIPTEDLDDPDFYETTISPHEKLKNFSGVAKTEIEFLAARISDNRAAIEATGDDAVTDSEKERLTAETAELEKQLAEKLAAPAGTPEPESTPEPEEKKRTRRTKAQMEADRAAAAAAADASKNQQQAAEGPTTTVTPPETANPPTEAPKPPTEAKAPEVTGWQGYKIACVKIAEYEGFTLAQLEPAQIESLKVNWVEKYRDKIAKNPEKQHEANMILEAFAAKCGAQ